MRKLFFHALLLVVSLAGWAQDESLKMRFDFSQVSGSSVTDVAGGVTARAVSPAKVIEMGDYHVLNLGTGSGYLDLTSAAGAQLAATDDYTISVYYRVDESASLSGNGYFLWAFSTLASNTATAGAYTAYRLNAQRVASATAGYNSEVGGEVGTESAKGRWVHVAFTQSATTGRLYIDGHLQSTITSMPKHSAMFASAKPGSCWIGRAPFSGDSYLRNTLVYDFRFYDRALTGAELLALSVETTALDNAYIHGAEAGSVTALQTAVKNAQALLDAPDGYLPDALRELEHMVAMAQAVVGGSYSQAYIDQIVSRLNALIATVKSSKGVALPSLESLQQAYSLDRGFIHPGGLHTQADFDRVKQQLADKNPSVVSAYNKLKAAAYAQSNVQTNPVETIVRGGGVGENYINAARGATMAYQNALRWKIDGTKANADAAVRILMAWARTTKYISGDSNYALAAGLYGYQFAQAAELVRDYDGWSREDFEEYKQWMMGVWYPTAMRFLCGRNGTWENPDKWWEAPGHYWSNWGLCNALCVISIGILCDDVYVYNQGMSFFKYDQVGTYRDPRTEVPIKNDGLTEFLGNLVVTTVDSDLETGAYGQLGQMNESGRDTGHSAMALGLAVDIAKVGWNQGDDLFAYMNHRLAAGIEYVAAQVQSVPNLPWTNYIYGTNGYYYTDSRAWVMEGPALGAQMRPYWGTVIGIYEGVKGVRMPFAEKSYSDMGIDEGGLGATSGGYDHLGYSVLMNTRVPQLAAASQVPTELSPKMEYSGTLSTLVPSPSVEQTLGNLSGKTISHGELGGLINTYNKVGGSVPNGQTLKLMPQLPAGEEDTGKWQWNTGETTRDITVQTDRSFIYRVTYTNKNGVESSQAFPIACESNGTPVALRPFVSYGGAETETDTVSVLYGSSVALEIRPVADGGTYRWSSGETTQRLTTVPITSARDFTAYYTHTSGVQSACKFHVGVHYAEPFIIAGAVRREQSEMVLDAGTSVVLGLKVPALVDAADILWSNGTRGSFVTVDNLEATTAVTATFELEGQTVTQQFTVYVRDADNSRLLEPGNYLLRHRASGKFMTAHGKNELVTFESGDADAPAEGQVWFLDRRTTPRYNFVSLPDSLKLTTAAKTAASAAYPFGLYGATGTEYYALYTGTTASSMKYWEVEADGAVVITSASTPSDFPFELIPASTLDAVVAPSADGSPAVQTELFLPDGRRAETDRRGIVIVRERRSDGSVTVGKRIRR